MGASSSAPATAFSPRGRCRALRDRGADGFIERNADLPPDRRIEFRVDIHLGDVVEEAGAGRESSS
jgi:hypothetical protein